MSERCEGFVGAQGRPCPRRARFAVEHYTGGSVNAVERLACGGRHLEMLLEMAADALAGPFPDSPVQVRVLNGASYD